MVEHSETMQFQLVLLVLAAVLFSGIAASSAENRTVLQRITASETHSVRRRLPGKKRARHGYSGCGRDFRRAQATGGEDVVPKKPTSGSSKNTPSGYTGSGQRKKADGSLTDSQVEEN